MFFSPDTSRKCTPYNQKVYTTRECTLCTLNIGNYQPPRVVRFLSMPLQLIIVMLLTTITALLYNTCPKTGAAPN